MSGIGWGGQERKIKKVRGRKGDQERKTTERGQGSNGGGWGGGGGGSL